MRRTRKHANEFSHGPEGTEFFVPFDRPAAESSVTRYANKNAEEILAMLIESWRSDDSAAAVIASALADFVPRSNYQLETSNGANWLLMESRRLILFANDVQSEPPIELPSGLDQMVRKFGGFQFGFKPNTDDDFLMPCSGFFSHEKLKRVSQSDESYLWEDNETVIGGVYFYSTDCGNQFVCRRDGSIAKWNMGNSTIENAFSTCMDFATEFKKFYTAETIDRTSLLCG